MRGQETASLKYNFIFFNQYAIYKMLLQDYQHDLFILTLTKDPNKIIFSIKNNSTALELSKLWLRTTNCSS